MAVRSPVRSRFFRLNKLSSLSITSYIIFPRQSLSIFLDVSLLLDRNYPKLNRGSQATEQGKINHFLNLLPTLLWMQPGVQLALIALLTLVQFVARRTLRGLSLSAKKNSSSMQMQEFIVNLISKVLTSKNCQYSYNDTNSSNNIQLKL